MYKYQYDINGFQSWIEGLTEAFSSYFIVKFDNMSYDLLSCFVCMCAEAQSRNYNKDKCVNQISIVCIKRQFWQWEV